MRFSDWYQNQPEEMQTLKKTWSETFKKDGPLFASGLGKVCYQKIMFTYRLAYTEA